MITKTSIYVIVIIVGCWHVRYRKRKQYRKHDDCFPVAYFTVREEREHYYQQKQIPVIVKHTPPLIFYQGMPKYAHLCKCTAEMIWQKSILTEFIFQNRPKFLSGYILQFRYGKPDWRQNRANRSALYSAKCHAILACGVLFGVQWRNAGKDNLCAQHIRNVRNRPKPHFRAKSNDLLAPA